MAISFVDSWWSGHLNSVGNKIDMVIPASAQADDVMIAYCHQSENTSAGVWDDDGGGGNGWTQLAYNRTTGGRDMETAVYFKVHSGSENDPTFTHGLTEPMSGSIVVYRGVETNALPRITYKNATNDPNPPNPDIQVDGNNATVICFHSQTHDDVTESAPPTGFSMRVDGWVDSTADHMNHYVADITGIDIGTYQPPDWQHTAANTTPEYQTYTIALLEPAPIGINTWDNVINWGDTDKVVTGFGFDATQGSGKLELWSDSVGTIKQAQSIDSWSDTSIQFDTVQGSLSDDTVNYLVITNDNGDNINPIIISFGLPMYEVAVQTIEPDHLWMWDGDYTDSGFQGGPDATQGVVGTHQWATGICDGSSQAMRFDDVDDRREAPDSSHMNVSIDSKERTVAGWIQLGGVQKSMGAIWKEGGGVQNLAFLVGLGNVLMAQGADSPGNAINAQAVAEIKLTPSRPYHIAQRYSLTEDPKEFRLYLDGVEQPYALTNGNPLGSGGFNSHSGDITWGSSDNNLETGGTDIRYAGQEDCTYQGWCSWSDHSSTGGALHKTDHIRDILFRRGALPKYFIDTDSEANMQSDLNTQLTDTEVEDWPLGIRIQKTTEIDNNLTLNFNNITFNPRCTIEIEWRGSGTLNIILENGSKIDENKLYASKGGTFNIISSSAITIFNMKDGSDIVVLDHATKDIIFETSSSIGNFEFSTLLSAIDVIVIHDDYNIVQKFNVDSTNDSLVQIIQENDYSYNNPI